MAECRPHRRMQSPCSLSLAGDGQAMPPALPWRRRALGSRARPSRPLSPQSWSLRQPRSPSPRLPARGCGYDRTSLRSEESGPGFRPRPPLPTPKSGCSVSCTDASRFTPAFWLAAETEPSTTTLSRLARGGEFTSLSSSQSHVSRAPTGQPGLGFVGSPLLSDSCGSEIQAEECVAEAPA